MKKAIIVGTSDFDIEKETIDLNVTVFINIIGWTISYFEKQNYGHLAAITSAAGLRGSRHIIQCLQIIPDKTKSCIKNSQIKQQL